MSHYSQSNFVNILTLQSSRTESDLITLLENSYRPTFSHRKQEVAWLIRGENRKPEKIGIAFLAAIYSEKDPKTTEKSSKIRIPFYFLVILFSCWNSQIST